LARAICDNSVAELVARTAQHQPWHQSCSPPTASRSWQQSSRSRSNSPPQRPGAGVPLAKMPAPPLQPLAVADPASGGPASLPPPPPGAAALPAVRAAPPAAAADGHCRADSPPCSPGAEALQAPAARRALLASPAGSVAAAPANSSGLPRSLPKLAARPGAGTRWPRKVPGQQLLRRAGSLALALLTGALQWLRAQGCPPSGLPPQRRGLVWQPAAGGEPTTPREFAGWGALAAVRGLQSIPGVQAAGAQRRRQEKPPLRLQLSPLLRRAPSSKGPSPAPRATY